MSLESLALFDALIATEKGVQRKGATMPYTSMNGHMFAFLSKDGIFNLRLPSPVRERFVEEQGASVTRQYGAVMKEYVCVPPALFAEPARLAPYFALSVAYVRGLAPKASTR